MEAINLFGESVDMTRAKARGSVSTSGTTAADLPQDEGGAPLSRHTRPLDWRDEIRAYADTHNLPDLALVTVPVRDCNFPSIDRLCALGVEALEFALDKAPLVGVKNEVSRALRRVRREERAAKKAAERAAKQAEVVVEESGTPVTPQRTRRRPRQPEEPKVDHGLDILPAIEGMPDFIRATVDWPRLHGKRVMMVLAGQTFDFRLPVDVAYEFHASYDTSTMSVVCGFKFPARPRDWAWEEGRLYPISGAVCHEVYLEVGDGSVSPAEAQAAWPNGLEDARGDDWRGVLDKLVGCRVAFEVYSMQQSRVAWRSMSGPCVVKGWSQADGWLRIHVADANGHMRTNLEPERVRVQGDTVLVDCCDGGGNYFCIHMQKA